MNQLYDGLMRPTALATSLASDGLPSRIWHRDTTVFAPPDGPPDVHAAIRDRLGWLTIPEQAAGGIHDLREFAEAVREDGMTDVYLLGMGGSSLCAEVLRDVPGPRVADCRLTVLDTTDEKAVREATEGLTPSRALFVASSKSGTTIETSSLEQHFRRAMKDALGAAAGAHFVAVTDPGTPLVALAEKHGYRHAFLNPPDIGGRYAALSLFGLVPAALLGLDLSGLLMSATSMADACRADTPANPGLALGAFAAQSASAGRDKLTVLLSPPLRPLGAWIEQLVAESTGKNGLGILPIVDEPVGKPAEYGPDRAFVGVVTDEDEALNRTLTSFKRAGFPVFPIEATTEALGAEFFRWEFATAVMGAALGVNPFDEPNVRDAKQRTQAQLDRRRARGAFNLDPPFEKGRGYSRRESRQAAPDARSGRFVAVLDYLPADASRAETIARLRAALRRRTGAATTYGVGPRYLHSTGQYHQGGPNAGVFLLLTAADAGATPVPGADYTFSTLKQAQALGDFEALAAAGRHVVHYHIDDPLADYAQELERVLKSFG
jgi:glucose-6-phosphate isomerase